MLFRSASSGSVLIYYGFQLNLCGWNRLKTKFEHHRAFSLWRRVLRPRAHYDSLDIVFEQQQRFTCVRYFFGRRLLILLIVCKNAFNGVVIASLVGANVFPR